MNPSQPLALTGGTLYVSPDENAIGDSVVLIERGKITGAGSRAEVAVPPETPTLDCSGLTIAAGFWNSHVHFFERKWAEVAAIPAFELNRQLAEMLTRYGFTSVFDIGSPWENTRCLRDRVESGEVWGPRIRSTGPGLLPLGGLPPPHVTAMMGIMPFPAPEIEDARQAQAAVSALVQQGVDGIKLFASSPRGGVLPEDVISAATCEAHRSSKRVFVHPNSAADVLAALKAGADVIAHTTPHSEAWDETILTSVRERPVALTPTLALWKHFSRHDRISVNERIVEAAVGQLRAWLDCGGKVCYGSDLGVVGYDPGEEYALMAAAGMSFRELLASLTTVPAAYFGDSHAHGRVAAGFDADLVAFKGDPRRDLRALTDVRYTIRCGELIFSGE
ncbi:MAG: amidohydrolase family protein [Candidatus Cybelea sp.]